MAANKIPFPLIGHLWVIIMIKKFLSSFLWHFCRALVPTCGAVYCLQAFCRYCLLVSWRYVTFSLVFVLFANIFFFHLLGSAASFGFFLSSQVTYSLLFSRGVTVAYLCDCACSLFSELLLVIGPEFVIVAGDFIMQS